MKRKSITLRLLGKYILLHVLVSRQPKSVGLSAHPERHSTRRRAFSCFPTLAIPATADVPWSEVAVPGEHEKSVDKVLDTLRSKSLPSPGLSPVRRYSSQGRV